MEDLDESGKPKPQQRVFALSTFAYVDDEQWYLLTAGHIVEDLLEGLVRGKFRIVHSYLADYVSRVGANRMLLPFPVDPYSIPFIYDDGLAVDFACIPLSEIFRRNLEVNGVVPVTTDNLSDPEPEKIASHWIIGLPREVSRELNNSTEDCNELVRSLAVVMVPIEAVEDKSQLRPGILSRESQKPLPSFMGRITVEPNFDINGMSGGPVFGLISQDESRMTYSLVAIQNSWYPTSRITVGCPRSVFKDLVGMSRTEMLQWARKLHQY